MSAQLAFDLDEMIAEANPAPPKPPREPYTGRAPLHFTTGYFTLAELAEAQQEARMIAEPSYTFRFRHMWHPSFGGVGRIESNGHALTVVEADLRCDCYAMPPHGFNTRDCFCVGDLICQAICDVCEWQTFGEWNQVIEQWHDHSWSGWRDLPVLAVVEAGSDRKKHFAKVLASTQYPNGWAVDGAPMITERREMGTRHVPGYSPWGGFDISSTAIGLLPVERAA